MNNFKPKLSFYVVFLISFLSLISFKIGFAEPSHGIAMYGDPQLPHDFVSVPYVNKNATFGGKIIFGEKGGFDSLNPYIRKGRAPWGVRTHVVESLMARNWDEPFSLYGLLAETIETGPNREWVEFKLRNEARFSDGSPVTVEDVIWSFSTMGVIGHPRYINSWRKIKSIKKTGPLTVKFEFNVVDLELPLILGLRPILKKSQWEGKSFDESSLDIIIGSGPYKIKNFEPNRFIVFEKDLDYWGNNLPINVGKNNFKEIKYEYFADGSGIFEAFKAGELSVFREGSISRWKNSYNFSRMQSGDILQTEIPHQRPSGIKGFVMNTRRDIFKDWRVRDALIHAFNFEFINKTVNNIEQPRITSYFSNSKLGKSNAEASGKVLEYLKPFKEDLLPDVYLNYQLPKSNGDPRNRKNIRKARARLQEAGWGLKDGVLTNSFGETFKFNILLESGSTSNETIINIFINSLKILGIKPTISVVDNAQYKARVRLYDFDMTNYSRYLSLSPGNEQRLYWGSSGLHEPGTRNYMGINSKAADRMIDNIVSSKDHEDFIASVRALDRILMAGRYVIPIWYNPMSRLAHDANITFPDKIPIYGDWIGFLPDVWWAKN